MIIVVMIIKSDGLTRDSIFGCMLLLLAICVAFGAFLSIDNSILLIGAEIDVLNWWFIAVEFSALSLIYLAALAPSLGALFVIAFAFSSSAGYVIAGKFGIYIAPLVLGVAFKIWLAAARRTYRNTSSVLPVK